MRYIPAREDRNQLVAFAILNTHNDIIETRPADMFWYDSRRIPNGVRRRVLITRLMVRGGAGVVMTVDSDAMNIGELDIPAYHNRPQAQRT